MVILVGLIFLLSLVYAIFRYNVFGAVAPENIASYVVNKALAASSAISLQMAAWHYFRGPMERFPQWCLASFGFAVPHVFLSFALWSRAYYPKLYHGEKMNASGEFCLLFGVLNLSFFIAAICFRNAKVYGWQWMGAALLALHTAALGWMNWLAVSTWPGGMPPISLITCVMGVAGMILFLTGRNARRAR